MLEKIKAWLRIKWKLRAAYKEIDKLNDELKRLKYLYDRRGRKNRRTNYKKNQRVRALQEKVIGLEKCFVKEQKQ